MRHLKLVVLLLCALPALAQLPSGIEILPVPDDSATGTFGFRELRANGTNAVSFKAPTSIASNFTYTLPNALPGSAQCISVSTAGVWSYASCGGGGSSFYQTVYTPAGAAVTQRADIQFTHGAFAVADEPGTGRTFVGLFASPGTATGTLLTTGRALTATSPLRIAGLSGSAVDLSANRTLDCPNCVTTNTTQTISGLKTFSANIGFSATNTYDIGASATRARSIYARTSIHSNLFRAEVFSGSSVLDYFDLVTDATGSFRIQNSSSSTILRYAASSPAWVSSGHFNPSGDDVWDLGTAVTQWRNAYFDGTVQTDLLQVDQTSTFAQAATFNGGIVIPSGSNSTIRAGSGGAIYITPRGIASGSVSCTGVDDGWIEITTDNYLVLCRGAARYRAALSSY